MVRVWIECIPGLPVTPLLYPNLGEEGAGRQLFQRAFADFRTPLVDLVSDPSQADILLLAHNYPLIRDRRDYLQRYREFAQRCNKRIVVFWHGDGTDAVALPHTVVLRTSQYKSRLRPGEYIMPAYAEDLSKAAALTLRPKHDGPPVVGFCGWATFKNPKNAVGTFLRALPLEVLSAVTGSSLWSARIKGIWLRRQVLRVLDRSALVQSNCILRSSHSAHAATIRTDPQEARRAYIQNMQESDFALCIRGDGNYSLRFYEALSLGRVPLFLDTDCAFPLEDRIDYASFTVRVPLHRLSSLDHVAAEAWNTLSADRFAAMQRHARDVYEKYLSSASFLRYAVEHLFLSS